GLTAIEAAINRIRIVRTAEGTPATTAQWDALEGDFTGDWTVNITQAGIASTAACTDTFTGSAFTATYTFDNTDDADGVWGVALDTWPYLGQL
ncbi:MAG: hypothetical protein ABIG92_02085, partial [Candidatus Omnitrophota bacterium]